MAAVFVAYASGNDFQGRVIEQACKDASTPQRSVTAWSGKDTSGYPIAKSVETWIDEASAFVADVSTVNHNVTYEIGYAIGAGKPIRLIRSTQIDFAPVKAVALLDTLGYDSYGMKLDLAEVLKKPDTDHHWPHLEKNRDQPVFILQPNAVTAAASRAISGVKKVARLRFRSFNPAEVSRLTASEAYEQVAASQGVIVFWDPAETPESHRSNQRASFIYGVARGRGVPALLITHQNLHLPMDLEEQADRYREIDELDRLIYNFRNEVADYQNSFVKKKAPANVNILDHMSCGEPIAENEAASLSEMFLETDAYQRTLDGTANVLVGRKGSGKSAIFLQTRDVTRAHRDNIVIDLIPEGYQLVKLKEFMLDQLGFGARKEVISAFWEYVLWLEVAYKLIEKDEQRALRDTRLVDGFKRLEAAFLKRVDTGHGDFSERLKRLSSNVISRFEDANLTGPERASLDSSKVLEIIYGQDLRELREEVLGYLRLKGFVLFLLDNLDRFWTPGGFDADDALIVIGLTESMQEITRRFSRKGLDFRWAIFVRSDVYEFLVRGMADYGKLEVHNLDWSDRQLMVALLKQRVSNSLDRVGQSWDDVWSDASVSTVGGAPVLEFLVDGSMMRPRYLIRLFETARRRAITFDRQRIADEDYRAALKELGWQVLEDLDREIVDLVPQGESFLFELLEQANDLTVDKFRYFCGTRLSSADNVTRLLDVMLWNGSLGIREGGSPRYIFDVGYKRQYLSARIKADNNTKLVIHPTLMAALAI